MVVAVTRETQATILLVLGLVVGRLTMQGGYQSYVKSGLFWPLLLSAVVLVAVGGWSMWASHRDNRARAEHDEDRIDVVPDAHDLAGVHAHHRERVGWILLAPIAVLLLVAPAPLGAFAAQRDTANRTASTEPTASFSPLPDARDGAVDLTFQQTLVRTYYDDPDAIMDVPLRLVGFVDQTDDPATFRLTRFVVGCCAADGTPIALLVETDQPVPDEDTWVEAVVTWTGGFVEDGPSRLPVMELQSLVEVEQPSQPYEY